VKIIVRKKSSSLKSPHHKVLSKEDLQVDDLLKLIRVSSNAALSKNTRSYCNNYQLADLFQAVDQLKSILPNMKEVERTMKELNDDRGEFYYLLEVPN